MVYDKISALCKEHDLTIAGLERACGIGNAVIKAWKHSHPRSDKLKAVADYFHVSVDWLLTDERSGN